MSYLLTLCCFINFCHLINLSSSYQTSVSFSPLVIYSLFHLATYICTRCTHHKHNSFSCLVLCTLSAPIYLTYSPGVFGHRANVIWGTETWLGGFSKNNLMLFKTNSFSDNRIYLYSVILRAEGSQYFTKPRPHSRIWAENLQ